MTKLAMHTNIPRIKIKRKIKIGAFKKWAHKIKRLENMNTKPNAWEEMHLVEMLVNFWNFSPQRLNNFFCNFNKLKTKIFTTLVFGELTTLPLKLQVHKDLNKY
jgi:hypothetical protein